MDYDYDRREGLSPVQLRYLRIIGERLADQGTASLEAGVTDTGKRNVIQGLLRRGLVERDPLKSGWNSDTKTHVNFYRPTQAGIDLIEKLFGLRPRGR